MEDYQIIDEKQIEILREMKVKYDEITKIDMETAMGTFNDVVDGRAVLLEIGYRADAYLEFFKRDSDRFVVSQMKYVQFQNGHLINKRSSIVNQQIFGFVLLLIYPISLNYYKLCNIEMCHVNNTTNWDMKQDFRIFSQTSFIGNSAKHRNLNFH